MVFVFDERESRRAEDLRPALDQLREKVLLWPALRDPTEEEVAAVQEVFEFSDEQEHRLLRVHSEITYRDGLGVATTFRCTAHREATA